jgi:hypothetical protein
LQTFLLAHLAVTSGQHKLAILNDAGSPSKFICHSFLIIEVPYLKAANAINGALYPGVCLKVTFNTAADYVLCSFTNSISPIEAGNAPPEAVNAEAGTFDVMPVPSSNVSSFAISRSLSAREHLNM